MVHLKQQYFASFEVLSLFLLVDLPVKKRK